MESVGIGIDESALKKLHSFFESEEKASINNAYKSVGHEFNVASPKQLQTVLFEELNLSKTKRIKTGFSTDAESLEWLFATTKHPVLESLLRVREVSKLRTTVEGLLSAIGNDGRIHTTFQQTTTATGRLSSTEPNLQNIPIRTDEGRKISACFYVVCNSFNSNVSVLYPFWSFPICNLELDVLFFFTTVVLS